MNQILAAHIGNYPRIGEEKDRQRLRRALHHLQRKEISSHAFHDVEQSVIQEVAREQITADMDEVTHGHVSWHDPISHFCRKIKGINFSGLRQYFDTNTYYRVPVFTGKPRKTGLHSVSDFEFTQGISSKPVRTVLTGPFTLAAHSRGEAKPFDKFENRHAFFMDVIKAEIRGLTEKGAGVIQIDEPAFPLIPERAPLFKKQMADLAVTAKPAKLILAVYFTPVLKVFDHLTDLPLNGLHLDFTTDGKKILELALGKPHIPSLGFGIVNGRETRLDAIDGPIRLIKEWVEKKNPDTVTLSPSCGLEYLPRPQAFEKLKLVVKVKNELAQEQGKPAHG